MIDFILSSDNLPFTVAIGLMLSIALLEGVGMLLGLGFSNLVDSLFPDADIDINVDVDTDIDGDIDFDSTSLFTKFWSWLRVGKVPVLVLLIVFLTTFGLTGFFIQSTVQSIIGRYLPWFIAIVPALLFAFPLVRFSSKYIAKIIPNDESSAVSEETFIGKVATITLGSAKKGKPAEAKLVDQYAQTHYIMVEPENEDDIFSQTEKVLLVSHNGSIFKAIKNPLNSLID